MPTHDDVQQIFQQGIHAIQRGYYLQATTLFERALELCQTLPGTEHNQANCLHNLATTLRMLGKPADAEYYYRQALTLYQTLPNTQREQANCLGNLATTLFLLDKLAQAKSHYRQALTLYQGIPNTEMNQATCLGNLATTMAELGKPAEAEPYYHQALTLYQTLPGTEREQANCLLSLANTLHERGKTAEAEPYYHQALTLYQTLPNTEKNQANCLGNLANTLDKLGKPADAEPYYRQALTLYQDIPNTEKNQANCLNNLATTLRALGKPANAEPYYRQALTLYQTLPGTEQSQANCLRNLANALHNLGRGVETEPLYRQAIQLCEGIDGTEQVHASCLQHLASVVASKGEGHLREALTLYHQALTLYKTLTDSDIDQAHCLTQQGLITTHLGHLADAETYYHQALALYKYTNTPIEHATCLQHLANCLAHMHNRTTDTLTTLDNALDILTHTNTFETAPQRLTILVSLTHTHLNAGTHLLAQMHARAALDLSHHPTISQADAHHAHFTYAAALHAQAHATTNPEHAKNLLTQALNHALPAALFDDEYRYQLISPTKRRAWITNRAQPSMNLALTIATLLDDAPLVAELVAKWRMVGSLAPTPAAHNSDIFLINTMPDFTPEPDETLTRTPGPNLVLPHPRTTPLYQHPTIADRPRAYYR